VRPVIITRGNHGFRIFNAIFVESISDAQQVAIAILMANHGFEARGICRDRIERFVQNICFVAAVIEVKLKILLQSLVILVKNIKSKRRVLGQAIIQFS